MHPVLASKKNEIAALCHRHGVRTLEVFGSGARTSDFKENESDFDFLVTYLQTHKHDALNQFFGLRSELEDLLGRSVDLIEPGAVINPYVKAEIDRHNEIVFSG